MDFSPHVRTLIILWKKQVIFEWVWVGRHICHRQITHKKTELHVRVQVQASQGARHKSHVETVYRMYVVVPFGMSHWSSAYKLTGEQADHKK